MTAIMHQLETYPACHLRSSPGTGGCCAVPIAVQPAFDPVEVKMIAKVTLSQICIRPEREI
jgi:hypothetical protein